MDTGAQVLVVGDVANILGFTAPELDSACAGARVARTVLRSEVLRIVRSEPLDLMITSSGATFLASPEFLAAFSALLKLNSRALEGDTRRRAEILRSVPETASLLRFAVSEEYLDARHRAGADSL